MKYKMSEVSPTTETKLTAELSAMLCLCRSPRHWGSLLVWGVETSTVWLRLDIAGAPLQGLWSCFVLCPGHFPNENTALEKRRMPGIERKGKEEKFHVGVLFIKVPLI